MNELAELLPIETTVPLGRGTVTITGVPLRKVAALLEKYPELLLLLNGKADVATLVAKAPNAVLDIVSLALVDSDAATLKAFDVAPIGQQFDILVAIRDATLGGEKIAPFLDGVMRGLARATTAAPSPSTEPSN